MPNNIIKSFANKSSKTENEVEKLWNELKTEYKDDYEKITGTLKNMLKIDESSKGTYVARKVKNAESLYNHYKNQGVNVIPMEELHCTIAYSKKEFKPELNSKDIEIMYDEDIYPYLEPLGNDGCIVMKFKSKEMTERWQDCIDRGAIYDYESYIPHITIAIDEKDLDLKSIRNPDFNIILSDEYTEELNLNWKDKLTETHNSTQQISLYFIDYLKNKFNINDKINLKIKKSSKSKYFGDVDYNSMVKGKFNITIEDGSLRFILSEIAHEFTHIVQFKNNNLYVKDNKFYFNKKEFITVDEYNNINNYTDYYKLPWEAEAKKNEKLLVDKFMTSEGIGKLKGINSTIDFIISLEINESVSIKSIKEKFKDYFKKINIYEYDDKVSIDLIISNEKNQGYGTKLMNEIIDYCDKTNKTIILTPSDEFGGNKKRLIEFYKRFGFLENKGKNKIFGIFESMYRLPKNKQNENYKGLNMEIEKLVEGLGKAKLSFVTKAMIKEGLESLTEDKLNEYLDLFEEYKNVVLESEKFATLVEGKDVDSLSESEIEDLIEKCSEEMEDDEDDDKDKDENDEDLSESEYKAKKEELIKLLRAYDNSESFKKKLIANSKYIDSIILGKEKLERALYLLGFKKEDINSKDKSIQNIIKFLKDNLNESLEENYIGKAMLELSKGNTGSAIENFKSAMLSTLSKNETYKEIDTKMSLFTK